MRYVVMLLFVLLSNISTQVQAETYSWGFYNSPTYYPSASEACAASGRIQNPKYVSSTVSMASPTIGSCSVTYINVDGVQVTSADSYTVQRWGDSCPSGATYNSSTGGCDTPPAEGPCAAKKGQVVKSFHWLSNTDEPTQNISIDGCSAAISGFTVCKTAAPSTFSCTGTATWSGEALLPTAGTGEECSGDDCNKNEPQDTAKNEPCIKQDTGAGFTCTSKIEDSKTGKTNCGTANGVMVCTPEVKPVKITQTQQVTSADTVNPDGSISNKNITKTTKTVCVADKCTDTSYTTTTNSGKSSNGMPTGTAVSCVGSGCEAQTGGGGTVSQIGGGGASKDPKDGKATEQKDCTKPVECEGDIYQCAILKQDYISYCANTQMPTDKQLEALKTETSSFQEKLAQNQTELDAKAASVLNQFKAAASGGGGGGGKCLPDYAVGYNITMRFSATCEYLVGIRYAILCIAFIIAARRISREL